MLAFSARTWAPNHVVIDRSHPIGRDVVCLFPGWFNWPAEVTTGAALTSTGAGLDAGVNAFGPAAVTPTADSDGWQIIPPPTAVLPQPPCTLVIVGSKPSGLVAHYWGVTGVTTFGDGLRLRGSQGAANWALDFNDGTVNRFVAPGVSSNAHVGEFVAIGTVNASTAALWVNGALLGTNTGAASISYAGSPQLDLLTNTHPAGVTISYAAFIARELTEAEIGQLTVDPFLFLRPTCIGLLTASTTPAVFRRPVFMRF